MNELTTELVEHFKQETKWRPGLGIWIGDTVGRLFRLENLTASERAKRKEMLAKLTTLILELEENYERRAFKPVWVGGRVMIRTLCDCAIHGLADKTVKIISEGDLSRKSVRCDKK